LEQQELQYIFLVRRYWWLVLLGAVLAAAATFLLQTQQPSLYEASAKLFVGNVLDVPDPEVGEIESVQRLAPFYAELVRSFNVLNQAIQRTGTDTTVEFLRNDTRVELLAETSIITIFVRHPNPETAAILANAIVEILQEQSPTISQEQEDQILRLQNQIEDITQFISTTNAQYEDVLEGLNDPEITDEERLQLNQQASNLTTQINGFYNSLAILESDFQALSNRTNRVEVIEDARPNFDPLGLSPTLLAVVGGFMGAVVVIAGIVILNFFDSSIRSESDLHKVNAKVLGNVSKKNWSIQRVKEMARKDKLLRTEVIEQYRIIINQLSLVDVVNQPENPEEPNFITPYLFMNVHTLEARAIGIINLAVAASDLDLNVLVIDIDEQQPLIGQIFSHNDRRLGLSRAVDFLSRHPEVMTNVELTRRMLNKFVYTDPYYPNLSVISSYAPGAGELQTQQMVLLKGIAKLIKCAQESEQYDMIIIAAPYDVKSSASYSLITLTQSRLLLLLESGTIDVAQARAIINSYQRIDASIAGVILQT